MLQTGRLDAQQFHFSMKAEVNSIASKTRHLLSIALRKLCRSLMAVENGQFFHMQQEILLTLRCRHVATADKI